MLRVLGRRAPLPQGLLSRFMSSNNNSSRRQSKLPIIDVSPFLSSDAPQAEKQAIADQLHLACQDTGFFYVVGHGVTSTELLADARTFFEQDAEAKDRLAMATAPSPRGGRGYQRLGENVTYGQSDYHEAIDFIKELPADHRLLRGLAGRSEADRTHYGPMLTSKNLWPDTPSTLRGRLEAHVSSMTTVGHALLRAMALGLKLPGGEHALLPLTNEPYWVMRVIGYPPLLSAPDDGSIGISCGEHCDYGCLTFITADPVKGSLQVRGKDGEWLDADPMPGAMVVNIGDMVSQWTRGLYQSTPHRVVNTSEPRISIPFFFEPNFDAVIKPLSPTGEDGPGVMYGDHVIAKVNANFNFDDR